MKNRIEQLQRTLNGLITEINEIKGELSVIYSALDPSSQNFNPVLLDSIKNMDKSNANEFFEIINGALTKLKKDTEAIRVPSGVHTIATHAFSNKKRLSYVELPEGLVHIGPFAFDDCERLHSVKLPSTLESIDTRAFGSCIRLSSLDLPDSLLTIGQSAFEKCLSLEAVCLPPNLESIDLCAFENCSNLKAIFIPKTVDSIGTNAFLNCPLDLHIFFEGRPDTSDWSRTWNIRNSAGNIAHGNITYHASREEFIKAYIKKPSDEGSVSDGNEGTVGINKPWWA